MTRTKDGSALPVQAAQPHPAGALLPPEREAAKEARTSPHHTSRSLRVAMLTYSFYESDNRVRRYAEALAGRGEAVDVFSLRRQGQGARNELNGVRIFRIQERVRDEKGKLNYLTRILKFLFRSAAILTRSHLDRPYDLIHVHSVPDFEIFAAIIPKLTGTRVILDIHDIVPEFYAAKFNVRRRSSIFRLLVWAEKLSVAFADHVIISNDLWRRKLCSRSVHPKKCTSMINYPDETLFSSGTAEPGEHKIVFLYPGTLNHHQGLDLALLAFNKIKHRIPGAELQIIGDGPAKPRLARMVTELGLEHRVLLQDPVPLDLIADKMAGATIGIIPKRNDEFGGEAFSTKSLEFMSLGIPIIISRTRIDQYYFNDSLVRFFEPENVDDLAETMLDMAVNPAKRERLVMHARAFAQMNCWGVKKSVYTALVDQLIG